MNSVKWYESAVIQRAIATAICALLSALGHALTQDEQNELIKLIPTAGDLVTGVLALWAGHARLGVTTVIEGSKGEAAVVAQGTTVTPKGP